MKKSEDLKPLPVVERAPRQGMKPMAVRRSEPKPKPVKVEPKPTPEEKEEITKSFTSENTAPDEAEDDKPDAA